MDVSLSQQNKFEAAKAAVSLRTSRILRLLESAIFYGLLVLILAATIPYGTVEAWSQSIFHTAVFALGFLWTIHGLMAGTWRVGNLSLFYPLMALIVFAILQSLSWSTTENTGLKVVRAISADPFESWVFALRLSALTLAGILAARFMVNEARLTALVYTMVLVALVSAIFGIVRQTLQHDHGFLLAHLPFGGGFAQFINKNHFAFLIEPAIGLLVGLTLWPKGRRERLLVYLSAILVMWVALVMSRSRGGVLAVAVQMIGAALLFLNTRKRATERPRSWSRSLILGGASVIVMLMVIVAGVIWFGGDQLSTGLETAAVELKTTADDTHEGTRRRDIWQASWRMARANPIAGAGLGGYWAELPVYHDASGVQTPQQAHNDYLELLASSGLIGAAIFVWFAVMLIRNSRRALRSLSGFQQGAALGAMLGMVGIAVHSLIEFGLHTTSNGLVCMMLLAILSLDRIDQRSRTQAHRISAFR